MTGMQLKAWLDSMRTRYSRLTDTKSCQATPRYSDRDRCVLATFVFLKDHIIRQSGRTSSQCGVPPPAAGEPQAGTSSSRDDLVDDPAPPPPTQPHKKRKRPSKDTEDPEDAECEVLMERVREKTTANNKGLEEVLRLVNPKSEKEVRIQSFLQYLGRRIATVDDDRLTELEDTLLRSTLAFTSPPTTNPTASPIHRPRTHMPMDPPPRTPQYHGREGRTSIPPQRPQPP